MRMRIPAVFLTAITSLLMMIGMLLCAKPYFFRIWWLKMSSNLLQRTEQGICVSSSLRAYAEHHVVVVVVALPLLREEATILVGEDRVTHVVRVFPADDANVVSGLQSNRVARCSRYDSQQHPLEHFGSNFSWTVYGSSCTTTTLQRRFKRYFRGLGGRTSRVSAC